METLEEKVFRLTKLVDNIILLLEWDDTKPRWIQTMKEVRQGLEHSDLHGIEILLHCYGGMGSFNDLIIGQNFRDGNFIGWKKESDEKNKILNLIREEAYDVATEIKRLR